MDTLKEEKNNEVSQQAHDALCDLLLDNPTVCKLGDDTFEVKNLRLASRLMISKIFTQIKNSFESEIDDDIVLMYKAITDGINSIENCARIVAICICNHKFVPNDRGHMNEKMIDDTYENIIYSTIKDSELVAIAQAASKGLIDLSLVFQITLLVNCTEQSLRQQRMMIREQLASVPKRENS